MLAPVIHHVILSCENTDETEPFTEPSERHLHVEVIAGVANLAVYRLTPGGIVSDRAEYSVEVSAHSLIKALQVQLDDDAEGLPDAWKPPKRKSDDDDAPPVDDSAFPHPNLG